MTDGVAQPEPRNEVPTNTTAELPLGAGLEALAAWEDALDNGIRYRDSAGRERVLRFVDAESSAAEPWRIARHEAANSSVLEAMRQTLRQLEVLARWGANLPDATDVEQARAMIAARPDVQAQIETLNAPTPTEPGAIAPHRCPVCNGHGTVSNPPWIAGDQQTWSTSSMAAYPCKSCNGTGIIWSRPSAVDVESLATQITEAVLEIESRNVSEQYRQTLLTVHDHLKRALSAN